MKRAIALLLALFTLLLYGCGGTVDKPAPAASSNTPTTTTTKAAVTDPTALPTLTLVSGLVTENEAHITVEWLNSTSSTVQFGAAYDVQTQQNGEWVTAASEPVTWIEPVYILEPGQKHTMTYDLQPFDLQASDSLVLYRLAVTATILKDNDDASQIPLYLTFCVPENRPLLSIMFDPAVITDKDTTIDGLYMTVSEHDLRADQPLSISNTDDSYIKSGIIPKANPHGGRQFITVTWHNDTAYPVTLGNSFSMEYLKDGKWVNCALADIDYVFTAIAYELKAGATLEKTYYLSYRDPGLDGLKDDLQLYDMQQSGLYRLTADCTLQTPEGAVPCTVFATFSHLGDSLIADNINNVQCYNLRKGQSHSHTLEGGALENLRNWANALTYRYRTFEDNASPGDVDGGTAHVFSLGGITYGNAIHSLGFSYIETGESTAWLLIDGSWYEVLNPSAPPVIDCR